MFRPVWSILLLWIFLFATILLFAENATSSQELSSGSSQEQTMTDINILVFPDFESLDVFGPVEVLGRTEGYKVKCFSVSGGIIASTQGPAINTESIEKMNPQGVLLIPGGHGTRSLVNDTEFIGIVKKLADQSSFCLTVCTGSALLAKTGLLDHKQATSNKKAMKWVESLNKNVNWIEKARWVVDGKYYTSSGVSAGTDMALGFIADQKGAENAKTIARNIEYVWNDDPHNDPFVQQ